MSSRHVSESIQMAAIVASTILFSACMPIQEDFVSSSAVASANASAPTIEYRVASLEIEVAELSTQVAQLTDLAVAPTIVAEATPTPSRGMGALKPPKETQATATPRPTHTPVNASLPDYEIASIKTRVTETNDIWWKYAWILEVTNNSSSDFLLDAEVQFQDADGFVIDSARAYNLLPRAGETTSFSDYTLITMPGAQSVDGVYVQTHVSN